MLTDALLSALFNAIRDDPTLFQGALAFIVPRVIEAIKRWSHLKLFHEHSDGWNRALSMAAALFVSLGTTFTNEGSLATGGRLILAYPSQEIMIEAMLRMFFQGGLHEVSYKTTVKGRDGIIRTTGQAITGATATVLKALGARKKEESE